MARRRGALVPLTRRIVSDLHASAACVYLIEEQTRTLVADIVVVTPLGVGSIERASIDDPVFASSIAFRQDKPVTAGSADEIGKHPYLAAFAPFPFTVCAVPLFAADGRRFGVLSVYWPVVARVVPEAEIQRINETAGEITSVLERFGDTGMPIVPEVIPQVVAGASDSGAQLGSPPGTEHEADVDVAVLSRSPLVYHLNKLAVELESTDQTEHAAEVAIRRLRGALSSPAMAILLVEVGRLRLIGSERVPSGLLRNLHGASTTKSFPENDAVSGHEILVLDSESDLARYKDDTGRATGWAVVPLTAGDRVVGVCTFEVGDREALDEALLTAFGSLLGASFERTRLHDTYRTLANQLQQALLPTMLPHFAGVLSTARYVPATSGLELGGDWYDMFKLPDGRVGAVIGDVQGHNIAAAVVMGQLRSAVRSYAAEGHDPGVVLERTNRLLLDLGTSLFATCCLVWLDTESGVAEIATAGHEAPLLGTAGGAYEPRSRLGGIPLGIEDNAKYGVARLPLRPGDLLALYTDGLVTARDPMIDGGVAAISTALAEGFDHELETLADQVVARGSEGVRERVDDAALLLLRYEGRPADARRYIYQLGIHRHDVEGAPRARTQLRQVLTDWDLDAIADEVELLASEVVTNAIVHCDTDVDVRMRRYEDRVRVEVRDSDPHLAVPVPLAIANDQSEGGRGLVIVSTLASTWGNSPSGRGKTVWFEVRTPGAESLNGHARLSRSPRGDRELLSRSWRRVRLAPALRGADENGRQGVEALVDSRVLARLTPSVRDAITVAASTR